MQYTEFLRSPGAVLDRLRRGETEPISYRSDTVCAQIRRLPASRLPNDAVLMEQVPLTMREMQRGTWERMQAVVAGKRFVFGRGGRREAVIEGVKP